MSIPSPEFNKYLFHGMSAQISKSMDPGSIDRVSTDDGNESDDDTDDSDDSDTADDEIVQYGADGESVTVKLSSGHVKMEIGSYDPDLVSKARSMTGHGLDAELLTILEAADRIDFNASSGDLAEMTNIIAEDEGLEHCQRELYELVDWWKSTGKKE